MLYVWVTLDGRDLPLNTEEMLVQHSLLLTSSQLTSTLETRRPDSTSTSVQTQLAVKLGTDLTIRLTLIVTILNPQLISRRWTEDEIISQGDVINLLRAVFFFLLRLDQDNSQSGHFVLH